MGMSKRYNNGVISPRPTIAIGSNAKSSGNHSIAIGYRSHCANEKNNKFLTEANNDKLWEVINKLSSKIESLEKEVSSLKTTIEIQRNPFKDL